MRFKGLLAVLIYIIVMFVAVLLVQNVFVSVYESADEARLDTALHQERNSLDAVFLGPSTTYASWIAPYAFENYGITVYSMASAAQPLFAAKYMIEDMRRSQPDAVYIINVTHYLIKYEKYLPNFIETYPLTLNKLPMTAYLCNLGDVTLKKTFEMFFPVIKYHSRWSELTVADLSYKKDSYMSASYYKSFLNKKSNVDFIQQDFTATEPLSERDYEGLVDLMNYCKKNDIKALFVIIPQGEKQADRSGKQNTTVSILESRGFDVLDLRRFVDELSLDPKSDFYNSQHMNINGAKKVTAFLSEYLIEKYGFTDKREENGFEIWNKAVKEYNKLLSESCSLIS